MFYKRNVLKTNDKKYNIYLFILLKWEFIKKYLERIWKIQNNITIREEKFCWGISNFISYKYENNFVGALKIMNKILLQKILIF